MRFDCPECHRGIEVEARYIGKNADCPHCSKEITVPAVSGSPPPVELVVADDGDEETTAAWTNLPQKASETVASALRILRERW